MRSIWTTAVISLLSTATTIFAASAQPSPGRSLEEYRHFALIHEGDLQRGKTLFAEQEKIACSKCHSVDGTSGKAGPDLFAVGDKFGRREIIEAILTPSASIAIGYNTTTVETKSGEEY